MRMQCMGHPSGNTLNNFEKKVTTHSKSKTGNTFFGLEKRLPLRSRRVTVHSIVTVGKGETREPNTQGGPETKTLTTNHIFGRPKSLLPKSVSGIEAAKKTGCYFNQTSQVVQKIIRIYKPHQVRASGPASTKSCSNSGSIKPSLPHVK